ncbi:hypothetical protein [Legionella gresilensis]|uniref:preATP grasp domain-containing protein n=1 Tax=Legionella gresilensis TaxID=91823 RepID=UPI0010414267|nr:hypothetical protein [Legionella gresilensis]
MPKLLIGNVYSEAVVGDVSKLPIFTRQAAAVYAKRLAWLLEEDDLLILPSMPSKYMIDYISHIKNKNITSKNFFPLMASSNNSSILTSEVLLNDKLICELKAHISDKTWELIPYIFSSSIVCFSNELGLSYDKFQTPSFMNQSGINLLNSKATFRALAAPYITIAPGNICRSVKELYYVMRQQINNVGAIIIKKDFAANGEGNIAITLSDRLSYAGVREVLKLGSIKDITYELSEKLWYSLVDSLGNNLIVVESYLPSKHTLYAEYYIGKKIEDCQLKNYGIVRMDETEDAKGKDIVNWIGFQIPGNLPSNVTQQFLDGCEILKQLLLNFGYVGLINFDAIVTEDNKVLFTEINGRLGGCSHIQPIAEKLLGSNYLNTHCILTRNHVATCDLSHAINLAEKLSTTNHSGIVIMNEDIDNWGIIDYMVYAKSESYAVTLEQEFLNLLLN